MSVAKYYLDLDKVSRLESKSERVAIHTYYKDMLYCHADGRVDMSESLKLTLINSGYLLDHQQIDREKKINGVFSGD